MPTKIQVFNLNMVYKKLLVVLQKILTQFILLQIQIDYL